jgi:hypothetical protein
MTERPTPEHETSRRQLTDDYRHRYTGYWSRDGICRIRITCRWWSVSEGQDGSLCSGVGNRSPSSRVLRSEHLCYTQGVCTAECSG